MLKNKLPVAGLIFLAAFLPRIYKINNPVADWHSWRQADTAAVARNFAKDGFNLLYPQSDSLLALNDKGLANPNRYFINEFPFYNALVAGIYRLAGVNEVYARLVSAVFSSAGGTALYLMALKLFGGRIALTAGLFYAFNPYNIYYGRVIMPDPIFVSLSLMALARFVYRPWGAVSAVLLALSLLVKPYAIFLLPVFLYLGRFKFSRGTVLWLAAVLVPLGLWRWHVANHPEGSFASTWLLNGSNIRFSGAFFRWLIFDRLNRLIFATGGFVLAAVGFWRSLLEKRFRPALVWWLAVGTYMTVFAMGNVTHDYYQLPVVPIGVILAAAGFWYLIDSSKSRTGRLASLVLALALAGLNLAFGWYEVRGFYNVNHPEIVAAGKAVDKLTPPDALVIAAYNSDPAFLYQTNRHGWPDGVDLEAKAEAGASYYVSVNFDSVAAYLEERCPVAEKTDQYLIIRLENCL